MVISPFRNKNRIRYRGARNKQKNERSEFNSIRLFQKKKKEGDAETRK